MNIIYGVSECKLSSAKDSELECPDCSAIGTIEIEVKASYIHLFGLPFMPIAKKGTSTCSSCKVELENSAFKEPIKDYFNAQVSQSKTPLKLYSFTILLSLLIVLSIVISAAKASDNGLNLTTTPKKQNGYIFIEENGKLVEWILDEIESDSLLFSSYDLTSEDLIYRSYSKSDINDLKEKGKLVKINRPD